jgi:hypothetical protein
MREDPMREQAAVLPETSSGPPTIPEEQRSLYREILTRLQEKNISFAVAGAFALQEHTGIYRDTKDLDLFLTAPNARLALESLREDGFECEVCDPVWLYKVHRGDFFVDLITGMSNAALVVEDSWIERSKPAAVHGVETRVLGAEELLASKLFVIRRERFDGADIAHIVYGTRGKLDWNRVMHLVGEHWEILFWALVLFHFVYPAHASYVPQTVWEMLIARFQQAVLHPDANAKFRGSLVDDRMFAIDVKDWGLDDILASNRRRRLQDIKEKPDKK